MSLVLLAYQQTLLDEVAAALRGEGVAVASALLDSRTRGLAFDFAIADAVLIVPEQGVVSVGEKTGIARSLLGSEPPLPYAHRARLRRSAKCCGNAELLR